ncbi:hypothetical protein ILUMI_13552 [Ignelater luminosus]|uniref:CCHC-type domain-containing protein n=1 Tax=Ignelater luminosus TaxID=2038154 RepID=A0A8K0GBV0_IGNLU|nr:hypothetical protein ILUMI_13552 [Ignelater luminosus]
MEILKGLLRADLVNSLFVKEHACIGSLWCDLLLLYDMGNATERKRNDVYKNEGKISLRRPSRETEEKTNVKGSNSKSIDELKNITCYKCFSKGHYASSYGSPVICNYCKDEGHIKRSCPKLKKKDEQFESLSGVTLFSSLDLTHGYLQIPLSESAKPKTAFIISDETGQFNRMVFGLVNALIEFCRLIALVLGHLRNKVVLNYLDDILIPATSWEEMFHKLTLVFKALQDVNLTLRVTKCRFGVKSVYFLEFTILG